MTDIPKPSEIMRHKRPYLFSDSSTEGAYTLPRTELSHCLDSLTERNQHQDFEVFARKLCEREICPNLRAQTGPEGGGDGKVDTETYPVADEISERWFQGLPNAGNERWGFAFSTKNQWQPKVRSDVQGMIETGRIYDRIFFVTSRPARAKTLHEIQDELEVKFEVPVTILDCSWIIDRVFEKKHEDLAFKHLRAGQYDESKLVVGPLDIKRQKRLDALEESLTKSTQTGGEITQSVVDSLEAAIISRMLEKPRVVTFGRFERAIELAKKYGTKRQEMQSIYERAWTDLWWFDRIDAINDNYEKIEKLAFVDNDADDMSKLLNLYQVLFGRVIQGFETAETLDILKRGERFREKIDKISLDTSRPNNALYGKMLGYLFKLPDASHSNEQSQLDNIWNGLSKVIDDSQGLGEFPAEIIELVTDAIQPFVQGSDALDAFILKLAEFMGKRAKEGKLGEILFSRGEQLLKTEEPIKAIQFLGQASIHFMKDEYQEEQFKTLYCLSMAYSSAGLLWAARATTLLALARIIALSDEPSGIRQEIIPTAYLFAITSIQLGRFVDVFNAVQLLNSTYQNLPLSNEVRESLIQSLHHIDCSLVYLLVKLEPDDLRALSDAPDILQKSELLSSRMILLLLLGYGDTLEQDGNMPEGMSVDGLVDLAELAANQLTGRDLPNKLMMYQDGKFASSTVLLGVDMTFSAGNSVPDHLLCEVHICALECFLATAIENIEDIIAHTDSLSIIVAICEKSPQPEIHFEPSTMILSVNWPKHLEIQDTDSRKTLCDHLIKFCVIAINAIAFTSLEEDTGFFAHITKNLVLQQTISFSNACLGNNRVFGTPASTINDFKHLSEKSYPLKENAPNLIRGDYLNDQSDKNEDLTDSKKSIKNHGDYQVNSITNLHLWDKAGWSGMLFVDYGTETPPLLALIFRDEEMAKSIFSGWRNIFGKQDENDTIRLTLIKGFDKRHPFHYRAIVSKNFEKNDLEQNKMYVQNSRIHTMEPQNSQNLDRFLDGYNRKQCFYFAPAVFRSEGNPYFFVELAILKQKLHIREAWEIGINDEDSVAIFSEDEPLVPSGVKNPPSDELIKFKKH